MSMGRRPRRNAEENDAFSHYWRPMLSWQRGELGKIKRRAGKRYRRQARREISDQLRE